ncbi:MAG: DUF2087 domain-containing protein [Nitriliruptorales bacterium]|nr:DUF2087 domain-containing protein [Nitriliruptorales bacterium]
MGDRFFKLLLDPERLAVVGAVATERRTVEDIVEHTGIDRRVVLETIAALVDGHLATEEEDGYQLDRQALVEVAQRLPQPAPAAGAVFHGMTEAEREILSRFFRGEELVEIPASRSKRQVVLERVALEFEPGRRYTEPEVNMIVGGFHDDHASLRRHLVDEGLLDREAVSSDDTTTRIEYWRSGGRVLVHDGSDDEPHHTRTDDPEPTDAKEHE